MYEIDFTPNAADDLDRLDHIELCDVDDVLAALAEDPRRDGCYRVSTALPQWECTIRQHLKLSWVILESQKRIVVTDVARLRRW